MLASLLLVLVLGCDLPPDTDGPVDSTPVGDTDGGGGDTAGPRDTAS